MKEIKVILSPHYFENEFVDEVSGIVFRKKNGLATYSISLEDTQLSGIQSALRKNILLPYDKETLDFVNGTHFAKDEKPVVEEKPVQVEVETKEEVKPAPKKRKRTPKKTAE